ncbi:Lymphoid-specific helicase, partial [Stegodyphus mimosarum]
MNQNHVSKVMPKQAAESNIGGIINNMLEQEHQSAEECAGVVITDEMIQEEINLENQVIAEEKRLQEKILDDEKKRNEEQCFKRLHLLLSKSSIYAKFMAEKLQKHEQAEKKKEIKEQRKLKSLNDDKRLNDISLKRSKTAKGGNKKIKCNMIDIYKKENMASMEFQECNDKNQKASADYTNYEHPKLFSGGTMRGYQIEGYEWLITLFENGVNGILADEMGLGKTIQCIAFIANMIEKGLDGPFLICGPLSTLPNWVSEFKRFTPDIPVILYHGQKADRKILRENIFKRVKCSGVMCHPVVITSFQIALIDCSKLRSIRWKLLAVDEAHRIKNFQCKLVMALKRFNCVHRLLLTGTPLQNDLSELWSLLNFILPEIFDDLNVFRSWFDISRLKSNGATAEIVAQEKEKQIVSTIHEILNPFLLRRTKADVQLQLPPKKEVIVPSPLSRLQQKYYADVLNKKIQKSLEKNEFTEVGQKRIRKSINYCELVSDDDFSDTQ